MYKNGLGFTQSSEKALEYYKIAADKGDKVSQYNVGISYYYGRGVEWRRILPLQLITYH